MPKHAKLPSGVPVCALVCLDEPVMPRVAYPAGRSKELQASFAARPKTDSAANACTPPQVSAAVQPTSGYYFCLRNSHCLLKPVPYAA